MSVAMQLNNRRYRAVAEVRALADQAFSRAAGAPLVEGNLVRLLKDAHANYPAWLEAISAARCHVHFENYIIHEDDTGWKFADALIRKAQEGVQVRLIYDWLGGFGSASRKFWNHLRAGGVEVRCYNPPHLDSPLGWLSRDHRKMLAVDGQVGFITGLCVGQLWEGIPEKQIEPWRDTGIEVRGPSVADVEQAFAQIWAMLGEPIPERELVHREEIAPEGTTALRVVASEPATAGLFRLDQLIAALARKRLWLTDAYYAGTTAYVQALRAAAMDGVDVRLLVPNGTDIPVLKLLSRSGYRLLLEAGVRVFEWNGSMLHAKTAVADGHWARVGSTNLNMASWFGNCELDAVIEDEPFAHEMEQMYLQDLTNATEIVLNAKRKVSVPHEYRPAPSIMASGSGNVGRAAAGVVRISNTIGAAFMDRRALEPLEARVMVTTGGLLLVFALLFAFFPQLFVYPFVIIFVWIAVALLYRGNRLYRQGKQATGLLKEKASVSQAGKAEAKETRQ
ncbi:MAG: phospholipase D-like domain-containing protein [Candidatus Vecturithrix sp.]|nr:phospholipase D-like domain-containing protein [Candidatus Vecturithrix sp.]